MIKNIPFETKFVVPPRALSAFEYAISQDAGAVLISEIEIGKNKGWWEIQAIFENEPNYEDFNERMLNAAKEADVPVPEFTIQQMPDINWLKASYQGFPPISVGDFYIYGSHITDPLPEDKICLKIDASTAFGTGEHETTRGCLEAIGFLGYNFNRVLDVGCGSGILSMAFAKASGKSVDAVDIDPESVRVATKNVKENDLDHLVSVWKSNGYAKVHRQYDLIFCNILAKPLIKMAPDLKVHLAPGGKAVLSGFLKNQEKWVVKAYESLGLTVVDRYPVKKWRTIVVQKGFI